MPRQPRSRSCVSHSPSEIKSFKRTGEPETKAAQLDRFLMQIEVKYPEEDAELRILDATTSVHRRAVNQAADPAAAVAMQQFAKVIPAAFRFSCPVYPRPLRSSTSEARRFASLPRRTPRQSARRTSSTR